MMNNTEQKEAEQLQNTINEALQKIGSKRESDLCRYLPIPTGGYMHHFTFRKMAKEAPEELCMLINRHINHVAKATKVPHKPRAARGSRKRRDQIIFSRNDIDTLLHMARISGNKEMIRKLTPKRDLRTIKRELISSIRHGRVEPELWNSYVEVMSSTKLLEDNEAIATSSSYN
ncbi:MAG: hypothetical protein Tsb0021_01810 [Chlamydiales bacterium]